MVKLAELMLGRGITELPLFASLASLYTASLSDADVSILRLLQRFEQHGLSLSHVNYQWGRPITLPLPPPISPQDFGALLFEMRAFDQARLLKSIRCFPFTRALASTLKGAYAASLLVPVCRLT